MIITIRSVHSSLAPCINRTHRTMVTAIPRHKKPNSSIGSLVPVIHGSRIAPCTIAGADYFTQCGPGRSVVGRTFIDKIYITPITGIPSSALGEGDQCSIVGFDDRWNAERMINTFIAAIENNRTGVVRSGFCCNCFFFFSGSKRLSFLGATDEAKEPDNRRKKFQEDAGRPMIPFSKQAGHVVRFLLYCPFVGHIKCRDKCFFRPNFF